MIVTIAHGDESNISLDITPFNEGCIYITHNGYAYVDLNIGTEESPNNQRIKLNAALAEALVGYEIVTTLNSSDATIPTSKAVVDALDTKVDKAEGKGLSTNDYTTDEKEKLAGITEITSAEIQALFSA